MLSIKHLGYFSIYELKGTWKWRRTVLKISKPFNHYYFHIRVVIICYNIRIVLYSSFYMGRNWNTHKGPLKKIKVTPYCKTRLFLNLLNQGLTNDCLGPNLLFLPPPLPHLFLYDFLHCLMVEKNQKNNILWNVEMIWNSHFNVHR